MSESLAVHEAASSAARSGFAEAMPFRRNDDAPFPTAGAALLLLLIGLAAWAWWTASRRSPGPAVVASAVARLWKTAPGSGRSARLVASTRLGQGAVLHVVEWRGTDVLVAVNGSSEPVVLGRHPIDDASGTAGVA